MNVVGARRGRLAQRVKLVREIAVPMDWAQPVYLGAQVRAVGILEQPATPPHSKNRAVAHELNQVVQIVLKLAIHEVNGTMWAPLFTCPWYWPKLKGKAVCSSNCTGKSDMTRA